MSSRLDEALLQLKTHLQRDEGQTMTEYSLLIVLIAVAVAVGAATLGGAINSYFGGLSFS